MNQLDFSAIDEGLLDVMVPKVLSWDLEIGNEEMDVGLLQREMSPDEAADYWQITCASLQLSGETIDRALVTWASPGMALVQLQEFQAVVETGGIIREDYMTPVQASMIVDFLIESQALGYPGLTWNGIAFDYPLLAQVSGRYDDCEHLARESIDLMFLAVCEYGFPLGLEKVLVGMGIEGKVGMDGSEAPKIWKTDEWPRVVEYVAGDTDRPLQLLDRLITDHIITWINSRGRISSRHFPPILSAKKALEFPEADNSWMDNPIKRSQFSWFIE